MYISLHVKYFSFLSNFHDTWSIPDRFSKITQISNFIKFLQWKPRCSVRTDRHYEANSRFSQFFKSTYKNVTFLSQPSKELIESSAR